ncbi:pyruvate dehydrogenase E2 component (dihydrolipoamide acetyltransferase) [[Emmonsia] crescens]|uniref:Pyruvate dehydrogenase E2 component (Dihydrolipoamide acetyltransferase) n=1 Tax=[Emmonsia] crescens TaxID=73230 RepID=A0A2B7ZKI0_9EURO|nr:pyruvate dehydrogenase E2 component (dihydrolipoamide acetyltransferase) [Emmonsia crescens]
MSYAEAVSHGARQSPREVRHHLIAVISALPCIAAPQPREIQVADAEQPTSSLIDVDSPHISSVPPAYESQTIKTTTQADRIEREREENQRREEAEAEAARAATRHARGKAKTAKNKAAAAKSTLSRNKTNPVVLVNAVLIAIAGAGLGFGAYRKHVRGALTWRVMGMWSGAVGAVGVVDYYVSKWFFQNKYPPNPMYARQWPSLSRIRNIYASDSWGPYIHMHYMSSCMFLAVERLAFLTVSILKVNLNVFFINSLFNAALKQSSALRRDLDAFAESPTTTSPAVQGQISASLTSFSRTIDDYSSLSKQELIPAKQELAFERLKNFRTELADYRQLFDRLRKEREDAQSTSNRNELLGRRPHHASTPENPYAQSNLPQSSPFANPNYPHHRSSPSGSGFSGGPADYTRENHALREQSFFSNTNSQLDEFLDRGRAVLGDLGQQREMLKGTQRRLYSVANTLGVSGDTIRTIERRAKQDKWIFWGGVLQLRYQKQRKEAYLDP